MTSHRAAAHAVAAASMALLSEACSSNGNGTGGAPAGAAHTSSSGSTGTSNSTSSSGTGGSARGMDPPVTPNLQGRMYDLIVPPNLDPTKPAPILIMLHGFTDVAMSTTPWTDMDTYMQMSPQTKQRGILLALGHGTLDPVINKIFWNATDACCDLDPQTVHPDDVGYVMGIIQDVKKTYAIDDKRIFALGHSNGGFMVNRLACDQADKFAAVVSLAGEMYKDQSKCAASAPIAYLQVQGDADTTVPYAGGHPENVAVLPIAPGAIETTQDWAAKNNCNPKADTSEPQITLMTTSAGPDTTKLVYNKCEANGWAELWTIHLGSHVPPFTSSWAPDVLDWLMAHPRP
jgi:polyhydroxybutyrate depolymerase